MVKGVQAITISSIFVSDFGAKRGLVMRERRVNRRQYPLL